MFFLFLLVIASLLSAQHVSSNPPGSYGVLSEKFLNTIINQLDLEIENAANTDTSIPTVSGSTSKVDYSLSEFRITLDISNPKLTLSESTQNLEILYQTTGFIFQFKYHVKQRGGLHISESGYVTIDTTHNINFETIMHFNYSTSPVSLICDLAKLNFQTGDIIINVQCSDSICLIPVSDILEAVEKDFEPTLQKELPKFVNSAAAKITQSISPVIMVGDLLYLTLDGKLGQTSTGALYGSFQGIFAPKKSLLPPNLPYLPINPKLIQSGGKQGTLIISEPMINSGLWALWNAPTFTIGPLNDPSFTTLTPVLQGLIPEFTKLGKMEINATCFATSPVVAFPKLTISDTIKIDNLQLDCSLVLFNKTKTLSAAKLHLLASLEIGSISPRIVTKNTIQHIDIHIGKISGITGNISTISSNIGPINTAVMNKLLPVIFAEIEAKDKPWFNISVPQTLIVSGPNVSLWVEGETDVSGASSDSNSYFRTSPFANAIIISFETMEWNKKIPGQKCATLTCPLQTTCCAHWETPGCCPLPSASCCPAGCCPHGWSCNGGECSPSLKFVY